MTKFVALVRGINVGGKTKVPMADLKQLFADLGYSDISTYINSGNVFFSTRARSRDRICAAVERSIVDKTGVSTKVVLRTPAELQTVIAGNPLAGKGLEVGHLAVTFLNGAPAADSAKALARIPGDDEFVLTGSDLYLHCPAGFAETKMTVGAIERAVGGLTATTRNWRTVTKLAALSAS
jgi:uncharacterized protein (DUF1697 family)